MSPTLAPDRAAIERALDELLTRDADARVLAMRSPVRRAWPVSIPLRGRTFGVAWCPSELELRERLDGVEMGESEAVVLLTPLDADSLSGDIVARLPRGRIQQTDRWSALRSLFSAHAVDPRLGGQRWLADLLLERDGYPPAPGGVLDLETAWRAVLEQGFGLKEGRADAGALLEWTLDPSGPEKMARLPLDARMSLEARLRAEGGAASGLVLAAVSAGHGADALPVALACGVVFGEAEQRPNLRDAAIRLESLLGGAPVDFGVGQALAEAGRRILDRLWRLSAASARAFDARAAEIIVEIRAGTAAALSPALAIGLEARMLAAAHSVSRAAETGVVDDGLAAWAAVKHAADHDRAADYGARMERLRMAARLACWLGGRPSAPPTGLPAIAHAYVEEGGFVDVARHALRAGDPLPEVAAAYARVVAAAAIRREEQNRRFALALPDWNAGGAPEEGPIPVEGVLERIVAPLSREAPVLLLVLDGLSFPVWRVLSGTIGRLGWSEVVPAGRRSALAAAATLPSVTEISRASLLCGRLARGDQAVERASFVSHAGLLAACRATMPPMLFHKADLSVGPELGAAVREAVSDSHRRVVAIVHNAIDAQLSGSDQLDLSWSADGLRQVAAILAAARQAGRIMVITGDHGHMIDEGTSQAADGTGDRWRQGGRAAADGEVAIRGGRVLSPAGGTGIIAAWSERIRYAARRGGYHGGASPQEILIPVAVLVASAPPPGWAEAPSPEPPWWSGPVVDNAAAAGAGAPRGGGRKSQSRQPELFEQLGPRAAEVAAKPLHDADWIAALLACEPYGAQRRLAGRGAPPDDQIRALLAALSGRGGRLTRAGLAGALQIPTIRLSGLVSAARRLLNLDQAQVLSQDGDDVILDTALLRRQFELGDRC